MVLAVVLLSACAERPDAPGGRVSLRGDTLVYFARGAAVATPAREVLRVHSSALGAELGEPTDVATLPSGGVVVFDARHTNGPALVEFDSSGRFLRVLGRSGRGPGEYASPFARLGVADDGTVFLHPWGQPLVLRFRDGMALQGIPLPSALGNGLAGQLLMPLRDHSFILNGTLEGQLRTGAPVFVRVDSAGVISDSIVAREPWMPEAARDEFAAGETVVPLPDGGWAHVRTDRIGFLRRAPNGSPMFISEVSGEALRYGPAERTELQRIEDWNAAQRRSPASARSVPDRKPLTRGGFGDADGRIWIQRTAEAVPIPEETKYFSMRGSGPRVSWGEPVHLVGFEVTGEYLGEWIFPVRSKVSILGRIAWAIEPDSLDVPTLVKYALDR